MAYYDSYYFLNYVCEKRGTINAPPLSKFILDLLPCEINTAKLLLFVLFFANTIIIAHLGKLFNRKYGWMAAILCFLSFVWIGDALKFEDDQFSYPILFLAAYFFLKGAIEKRKRYQALGLGLVFIGGLTWKGAILYLFGFGLSFWPATILSIISLVLVGNKVIGAIMPNLNVRENMPLVGLGLPMFLVIGYIDFLLSHKKILSVPIPLLLLAAYFSVITALSSKYVVQLIPLLAVLTMILLVWLGKKVNKKGKKFLKISVAGLLGLIYISSLLAIPNQPPTAIQMQAVKDAVDLNGYVRNDWELGYWIEWQGGTPCAFGAPQQCGFEEGVVLTEMNLDCPQLREYENGLRIYSC